jgi:hypothetical protein
MTDNMMNGNSKLNSADRDRKGNVGSAGREGNLINPILTKRELRKGSTKNLTAAPTPRAAVHTTLQRGVEDCSSAYFI